MLVHTHKYLCCFRFVRSIFEAVDFWLACMYKQNLYELTKIERIENVCERIND